MDPLIPIPLAYKFPPDSVRTYRVAMTVEGFVPILGGNEGKAEVRLALLVKGHKATAQGMAASHELTDAEVKFNDAKLPLSLETFTDFFPLTTLAVSAQGKVLQSSAPDKRLPVRLPGLDPKRLPELTFLPVELPAAPVQPGAEWSFARAFGESEVSYACTLTELSGNKATIRVRMSQKYGYDENESLEPTTVKDEVVKRVETQMEGEGRVVLDVLTGEVDKVEMGNEATSTVTDLATKEVTKRRLVTRLGVDREGAAPALRGPDSGDDPLWAKVKLFGQVVLHRSRAAFGALRAILAQMLAGMGMRG